jgi:hypothetical protein
MRTSFRHQSEAQPPNGPLTAAASPVPHLSAQPRSPVSTSPPGLLHLPAMAGGRVESAAPQTPMPDLKRRLSGAYTSALAEALASVTERGLA